MKQKYNTFHWNSEDSEELPSTIVVVRESIKQISDHC